jgi:predicted PurR-regulated permease PerM
MGPLSGGPAFEPVGSQAGIRRVKLTPGLLALVLTAFAIFVAAKAADLLFLLFLAILVAVYLSSFTDAIEKRTGWRRGLAFTAALVGTLLALWGVEALLVPPVMEQTRQLISGMPRYIAAWQAWLERMVDRFPALEPFVGGERKQDVIDAMLGQAESFIGGVFPKVFELMHGIINIVSVGVMAIYFARSPQLYVDLVVGWAPPRHRQSTRDVLIAIGDTLRSWVFAQILNMVALGLLTAVGLWALGVPYWLAFGLLSGLAAIVPFFGVLVATIVPALFVLDQGLMQVFLVILLGTVVHVIEGNLVAPMVFQRGVKLPPVLTIMSVLVVGTIAGPIGLLVAVPLLAVSLVLVRTILKERIYGDPPASAGTPSALLEVPPPAPGAQPPQ